MRRRPEWPKVCGDAVESPHGRSRRGPVPAGRAPLVDPDIAATLQQHAASEQRQARPSRHRPLLLRRHDENLAAPGARSPSRGLRNLLGSLTQHNVNEEEVA